MEISATQLNKGADSNNRVIDNPPNTPPGIDFSVLPLPPLALQAYNSAPPKTTIEPKKLFNLKFCTISSFINVSALYC